MDYVELHFPVSGNTIPVEHGYILYSALKKVLIFNSPYSETNFDPSVKIATISGTPTKDGFLKIAPYSKLRIRCHLSEIEKWNSLFSNKEICLNNHPLHIQEGVVKNLIPRTHLRSRIVVFQLMRWQKEQAKDYFLLSCRKALKRLEISAEPLITVNSYGRLTRRSIQVKSKLFYGYSVEFKDVSPNDALKLQQFGLGAKQHFGCGWFTTVSS